MQPTNHQRLGSNPCLQIGTCVSKRARDWKKVGREERRDRLAWPVARQNSPTCFWGRRRVLYMLKRSIRREIHFFFNAIFLAFVDADIVCNNKNFRWSDTSNELLQLATQHCHATKFRCWKLKQHVAWSWTGACFFQQFFTTYNNKILLRDNAWDAW